ncbi:MAG: hypothetical protein DRQ61_02530 [Gammaproteobacteria bacterium]|nr:MAG: hypothetical protein DRQ61_02530 [Gammaproteobacteria bacterium]
MTLTPFKIFRILLLLTILAATAFYTKAQRLSSTGWLEPLNVVIYPINADGKRSTSQYIDQLKESHFQAIDRFTAKQSKKYDILTKKPTITRLGKSVTTLPPVAPAPGDSTISNIFWSMKFRFWAWQETPDELSNQHRARMFVLYHSPTGNGQPLDHSYGLNKGLLGLVNAYASNKQSAQNNIVITHELLHTVGATDKYGPDGHPLFPDGYASSSGQQYPQRHAEIMAGSIPLSEGRSRMADSLRQCVVGKKTAEEIKWLSNI